ncbi:chemotaxis protein CheD [Thermodesulfobacteriota bacterium]
MAKRTHIIRSCDLMVSGDTGDMIVTYSLGSCLGVTIYDPVARVGGMIHCMLPLSKTNKEKSRDKPAMFVDTGIPLLFKKAYELGAQKPRIVVKAAGCAQLMGSEGIFRVGPRNFAVFKKLLWKNDLLIDVQHIGGAVSRTISLDVESGKTFMKLLGKESELC